MSVRNSNNSLIFLTTDCFIIIIITITAFLKGIRNYIETFHVSSLYTVAVIQQLQLMAHVTLFPFLKILHSDIITFQRMCSVSIMAIL